jgi:hypothetical protein
MTRPTDPLFDQRIADWLEVDPVQAPDQVLEVVLAALPSTPRRPASRVPRRLIAMPTSIRWSVAAAAVVGVLVVGGALDLNRPSQPAAGGPSPTPGLSTSPSQSANPTAGPSPTAVPAGAASWTPTGSMGIGRYYHAARVLGNGKVLVFGGYDRLDPPYPESGLAASAELYDPATGLWTPTGSMVNRRFAFTATLLRDGRVLVAGGMNPMVGDPMAFAELYDPASGAWMPTANMATPCLDHAATLLPDGKVLVVCGFDAPPELFDPASGSWTVTASMITHPIQGFTATLLSDGRVLVAGGRVAQQASAEVYDPGTETWSATGGMVTPRISHSATLLSDGRVLVTGGNQPGNEFDGPALTSAELYDPVTESWTGTGSAIEAMGLHSFACCAPVLLQDATVFMPGDALAPPQLYDPVTGSWTTTTGVGTPRNGSPATVLPDGRVLVAGGLAPGSTVILASVELYDPGTAR